MRPAFVALELAFIIKIYQNSVKRKEILERSNAKKDDISHGVGQSLFSSAGLTTLFNAMT